MKSLYFIFFSIFFLTGCLATSDLAKAPSELLSNDEKRIASEISKIVKQRCVSGKIEQSTGKFIKESSMKITEPAVIKRLYYSSQGWYKAEAVTNGIWDNFYYKPLDGSLVCGQRLWDEYSDTKYIQFTETGKKIKAIGGTDITSTPLSAKPNPVKIFRESIKLTYNTDQMLCDDIKWLLKVQAQILNYASQGKDYVKDKFDGKLLATTDDSLRGLKVEELLKLLEKQDNPNEILAQCQVGPLN